MPREWPVNMPLPAMDCRIVQLRRAAPYLAALAIAASVCPSLFAGLPPHTHDHNFHLANAVETERLLRSGRVVGWSDFQLGGHLANGFYPPAVSAAIAGLHWAARGFLSWDAAYAILFLTFLATFSLGVFMLTRQLVGAWAAVACAAVALLWDRGGLFNGGWYFYVDLGVWPFGFSVAWTLATVAVLPQLFAQGSARRVATVSALIALAVLTHPFALVSLTLLVGLELAVWSAMRRISLRALVRTAVAFAAGLAISAWWWVPFALRSNELERYSVPPISVGQYARQLAILYGGDLISWWVFPFALLGTRMAWKRREPWGRWFALVSWGLLLSSTELLYAAARIDVRHGWLSILQPIRLQAIARLLLVALAVLAASAVATRAWRRLRSLRRRTMLAIATSAACLLAGGVYAARAHVKLPRGGAPHRPTCYSAAEERDLQSLLEALRGRLAGHRIAVDNHCLVLAASRIEVPFFKIGASPANLFAGKFSTEEPDALAHLGVAVVLSDGPRTGPLGDLPLLARRGRFQARSMSPRERVETSEPAARATIERWSDEEIRLNLEGPNEADVRLWVNYSPQWRAWQGDQPLPIQPVRVGEARLIGFRAMPGEVRLGFVARASTRVCQALSLLALGATLVALARELLRKRGFRGFAEASR